MIATALKKIELLSSVSPVSAEPFDSLERSVYLGELSDGRWYAFNYAKPDGVTILSTHAVARLRHLLPLPQHLRIPTDRLDSALSRCGLVSFPDSLISIPPLRDRPTKKKERAFEVWVNVINACNFSCHYCYIPHLARTVDLIEARKHSILEGEVEPILSRLFTFCEERGFDRLHLKFAGGEPTLNLPLLEQFCSKASVYPTKVRVSFGMISNGSFDAEQTLPFLKQYRIRPSISLDGLNSTHDQIRHLAGRNPTGFSSWRCIEENTTRLCDHGLPPYFLFTLTAANIGEVDTFSEWCHSRKLGFRLSLVRRCNPPSQSLQEHMAATLVQLYRRLGEFMPVQLRFERDARFAEWNLSKQKLSACGACRNYVAVGQLGKVSSCQMTMGSPQGSVLDQPLGKIMDGFQSDPRFSNLANPNLKSGACRGCRFFHVCGGGCPEHSRQVFQTFDTPSPWCYVYGTLAPVYIKAAAHHLLRKALALGVEQEAIPEPVNRV